MKTNAAIQERGISSAKKNLSVKNSRSTFFFYYTALFILCASAVYCYFILNQRTLIFNSDGWKQHFTAFIYFGQYLRKIIRTLVTKHRFVVPQWNFHIGYGGDILTTLHYYVIGDPLNLLSVFAPKKYSVYLYVFLSVFRLYLAGIAFSVFCFYKNKYSKTAVISGSLVYVFFTYSFQMVARHPFFANPMIYLPLLLTGTEKVIKKEKPYLLILSVFLSACSNFYFFYMLVLITVLYVFFRLFFIYGRHQIKNAALSVLRIGAYASIGVLMSGCILLPVITSFLSDSRNQGNYNFSLFYDKKYYKTFLAGFLTSDNYPGGQTLMGFSCIALLAIFLMFLKRKQHTQLKAGFIIATGMLLFPVFGYIFNGFSYIANRWIWAYSMLVAYILVVMWKDLMQISRAQAAYLAAMMSVYMAAALLLSSKRSESVIFSVLVSFMAICFLCGRPEIKRKNLLSAAALIFVIISIAGNAFFFYSNNYLANTKNFVSFSQVDKKLTNTVGSKIKETVKDKKFYRYSGNKLVYNTDLLDRTYSTSFYWSTQNPYIAQYIAEMNLPVDYLYAYKNLNNRAALNALANVKYYYSKSADDVPYGFEKYKGRIYKNDNFLPFGYAYSKYFTRAEYDALSPVKKQAALLDSVMLETDIKHYEKAQLRFSDKNINITPPRKTQVLKWTAARFMYTKAETAFPFILMGVKIPKHTLNCVLTILRRSPAAMRLRNCVLLSNHIQTVMILIHHFYIKPSIISDMIPQRIF